MTGLIDTYVTVRLSGRIDQPAALDLADTLRRLAAEGVEQVVVDVSLVHDVDVDLLTVLAGAGSAVELTGVVVPQFLPAMHDAQLEEAWLVYQAVRSMR